MLNSEYTEEDLENAKRSIKASLLNTEGTSNKLSSVSRGLLAPEGLEHDNKLFETIDKITREDLDQFAWNAFNNPPVYSIVASKDTLEANKDFFETL